MKFNLEKFKAIFADSTNYAPLAEFRKLDIDDPRISSAYDQALTFLASEPVPQEFYYSLEHSEKMRMIELLAAGIENKRLRDDMAERPWAYETKLTALYSSERKQPELTESKQPQPTNLPTKPKWNRFAQKKPLSKWEISGGQKL